MQAWHGILQKELIEMHDINVQKIINLLPRPSMIIHHGMSCCNRAFSWIRAIDQANTDPWDKYDPPIWLKDYFKWSPHSWPVYWCDLPKMKKLDCGGLAAVATALLQTRKLFVIQTQLALEYSHSTTTAWRANWNNAVNHSSWISENIGYHEACSVIDDSKNLKIWDPTENRWLAPPITPEQQHGRIIAIKPFSLNEHDNIFFWHTHAIQINQWNQILNK